MSKQPRTQPHWHERIQHILQAISETQEFIGTMNCDQFLDNIPIVRAVTQNLQIVGEAGQYIPQHVISTKIKETLDKLHQNRNIIAHAYFGINYDDLWLDATKILPSLQEPLQQLYEEHKNSYQFDLQLNDIARATSAPTEPRLVTTHYPLLPLRRTSTPTTENDHMPTFFLRGRADEFHFLARRLQGAPTPINLITGPPQFGTTALLRAIQEHATRLDYVVVELQTEDLLNCITIADKCRMAITSMPNPMPDTPVGTNGPVPVELITHTNRLFTILGAEVDRAKQSETSPYNHHAVNLLQHLRAVCHYQARHRRVLITCDDIHRLRDHNRKARCALRHNLSILNHGVTHKEMYLPVTTILAGQPAAQSFLQEIIAPPPPLNEPTSCNSPPFYPSTGARFSKTTSVWRDNLTNWRRSSNRNKSIDGATNARVTFRSPHN